MGKTRTPTRPPPAHEIERLAREMRAEAAEEAYMAAAPGMDGRPFDEPIQKLLRSFDDLANLDEATRRKVDDGLAKYGWTPTMPLPTAASGAASAAAPAKRPRTKGMTKGKAKAKTKAHAEIARLRRKIRRLEESAT